jgi:uncharacterized repeat protein (TIGR03847 family)
MADVVELRGVDRLAMGAVGPPGQRLFMLEAETESQVVTIALEKEQVAVFAVEASEFLDKVAEEYPEEHELVDPVDSSVSSEPDPPDPLFRARVIGLGFDPGQDLVLVELREEEPEDDEEAENPEDAEGWIARVFATRAQIRAIVAAGADAVQAGRARWN